MRTFIKKFKNSIIGKILKAIWKILWWAIEAVIIFIAIIIVTQRVTNNEKAFLGFRIFNVATGSMEPEYAVGDILISREVDPSTIKVDDNIVYMGRVADYSGKIITHNVIEIEQNDEGEYLFHTKGIANTVEDPIVHEEQLYGIVVQNNRILAFICKILLNRYGLYFVVIMPIILYCFIEFVRAQSEKIEQEREEERKRLEARKRKKKKAKKAEIEETHIEEDMQEEIEEAIEEEIEEAIEEVKKPKKKTTKKEAEQEESKVTKTKKTANNKTEDKEEEQEKNTQKVTTRKTSAKKSVEETKKNTKIKKAKEE